MKSLIILLSIILDLSPSDKPYPVRVCLQVQTPLLIELSLQETAYFFCSIIYENMCSIGEGVNVKGVPSKSAISLAPEIRAKVKLRMDDLLLVSQLPPFS